MPHGWMCIGAAVAAGGLTGALAVAIWLNLKG